MATDWTAELEQIALRATQGEWDGTFAPRSFGFEGPLFYQVADLSAVRGVPEPSAGLIADVVREEDRQHIVAAQPKNFLRLIRERNDAVELLREVLKADDAARQELRDMGFGSLIDERMQHSSGVGDKIEDFLTSLGETG